MPRKVKSDLIVDVSGMRVKWNGEENTIYPIQLDRGENFNRFNRVYQFNSVQARQIAYALLVLADKADKELPDQRIRPSGRFSTEFRKLHSRKHHPNEDVRDW